MSLVFVDETGSSTKMWRKSGRRRRGRTLSKGDVVVMDNLSSHTGTRVGELINAVGATLQYLPR